MKIKLVTILLTFIFLTSPLFAQKSKPSLAQKFHGLASDIKNKQGRKYTLKAGSTLTITKLKCLSIIQESAESNSISSIEKIHLDEAINRIMKDVTDRLNLSHSLSPVKTSGRINYEFGYFIDRFGVSSDKEEIIKTLKELIMKLVENEGTNIPLLVANHLDTLENVIHEQEGVKIAPEFSFNHNSTKGNSNFNSVVKLSLSKGVYPTVFSASTEFNQVYTNNSFEQSFSAIQMNYGWVVNPSNNYHNRLDLHFQSYNNSFLSINNRTEMGIFFKPTVTLGLSKKGTKIKTQILKSKLQLSKDKSLRVCFDNECNVPFTDHNITASDTTAVRTLLNNRKFANHIENAIVKVVPNIGLFLELEKIDAPESLLLDNGTDTLSGIEYKQRYRIRTNLGLKLECQITKNLEWSAGVDFILPFNNWETSIFVNNDTISRSDLRLDAKSKIEYKFLKKVSLGFDIRYQRDFYPTSTVVQFANFNNGDAKLIEAPGYHLFSKITFKYQI